MNVQSAVRQQLGMWHGVVDGMIGGCSPDVLNKSMDDATIGSIASVYAHLVFSEDYIIQSMLKGQTPLLMANGWTEKLNVAPADPANPAIQPEWAKNVKMDAASFQEYAKAVYAATDAYLSSVSDSELQEKTQTPLGEQTKEWMVAMVLGTHQPQHAGEIAALLGVHGLKGLPF